MKNILSVFLLGVVFTFLFSCTENYPIQEVEKNARFFDSNLELSVSESSQENIEIPVYLTDVSPSPVVVSYEVSGDVESYKDLSTVQGKVVIPAGERMGRILLRAVDNDIVEKRNNKITIRLTFVDGNYDISDDIYIGYIQKDIIFFNDDCDLSHLDKFVGRYSVKEEMKSVDYEMVLRKSDDGKKIVMTNFWGLNGENTLFLDNCDGANPKAKLLNGGEYLFTHSKYGKASIYQLPEYTSTFNIEKGVITIYFKCCVSEGCFTGGFDSNNKTHHVLELTKK